MTVIFQFFEPRKLNHLSIRTSIDRPNPLFFENLKLPNLISLELENYYHDINFSALARLENLSSLTINAATSIDGTVSLDTNDDTNDSSINSLILVGKSSIILIIPNTRISILSR